MPNLGVPEIMVILVVALLVLGPSKLPEAGRQVGRALAEFRRWSTGMQDELRDALDVDATLTPDEGAHVIEGPRPPSQFPDQQSFS
jgi:sec-independent protein translocase protein TatA